MTRKTENNKVEFRAFFDDFQIRKVDNNSTGPGMVSGYAAVFNKWTQLGDFIEKVRPGAFTNTLRKDDIRALVNHDTGRVIGRTASKTLRLEENNKGLKTEIDLPDTTDGRDLAELVDRGDIDGMSFGFYVEEQKWTNPPRNSKEPYKREIIKVKLFEVSAVAFPAYTQTSLTKRAIYFPKKNTISKRLAVEFDFLSLNN